MSFDLPPSAAEFVEEQVRSGAFSTPEEVIVAALKTFQANCEFGDFAPGELEKLLQEGERSAVEHGWYSRDEAIAELATRLKQSRDARK